MDAEDILYLLYTSGTTQAEGIVTRPADTDGVAATHRMIFDLHDDDVFCARPTSVGHGHSYIVYARSRTTRRRSCTRGADWPTRIAGGR